MTKSRAMVFALGLSMALALLSGCSLSSGSHGTITLEETAVPAGAETTASPSSSPTTAEEAATVTEGKGCPAGGASLPEDAGVAKGGDLDGDGNRDTIWLGFDKDHKQVLGVETASGARFSMRFSTEDDPDRRGSSMWADKLGDGTIVILLDTGFQVRLYAVVDCSIVVTRNVQGNQYTFDKGKLGYGTGVGCPAIGSSGRHLVGYLAEESASGFSVSRTVITFSDGGRRATNGATTVLGNALPESNETVLRAQNVDCGDSNQADEQAS